MAVVTGWLMSVMGVSQEPTLLTIGGHCRRWSPSSYPVASVDLSPSLGVGATGYPRHVVIRKADAQAWTPELMSSGRDTWWL
jgi:hypothetical protein